MAVDDEASIIKSGNWKIDSMYGCKEATKSFRFLYFPRYNSLHHLRLIRLCFYFWKIRIGKQNCWFFSNNFYKSKRKPAANLKDIKKNRYVWYTFTSIVDFLLLSCCCFVSTNMIRCVWICAYACVRVCVCSAHTIVPKRNTTESRATPKWLENKWDNTNGVLTKRLTMLCVHDWMIVDSRKDGIAVNISQLVNE